MNVLEFIEALDKIDVHQATVTAVDDTKEDLEELNREQLEKGIQSDGEIIRWQKDEHYPYTLPYVRKKTAIGLQTEVVDLKLSGDFWSEIEASANDDSIVFEDKNPKTEFLEKNYTNKILGINEEKTQKYIEEIFSPAYRRNLAEQSGLNF